jgi:hypothetical protein
VATAVWVEYREGCVIIWGTLCNLIVKGIPLKLNSANTNDSVAILCCSLILGLHILTLIGNLYQHHETPNEEVIGYILTIAINHTPRECRSSPGIVDTR